MQFLGLRRSAGALLLFFGAGASAFGCAGKSETNDEGDAGEGSTTGGVSGSGGTTGLGGTAGIGGTAGVGGTGSGLSQCRSVCERAQSCDSTTPLDCAAECERIANEAATTGCTRETDRLLACMAGLADVCTVSDGACESEALTWGGCISGTATGHCVPETAPPSATCEDLCLRSQTCPGAGVDCVQSCVTTVSHAEATGCAGELYAYFGCLSTCFDICSITSDDCATTVTAYSDCFDNYCAVYPGSIYCGAA